MVRDRLMTQLVAKEKEPITPLVQTIRSLYDHCGVSSVLVIGGTGDYFDVADNILVLDSYVCNDATEKAKMIVANNKSLYAEAPKTVLFHPISRTRIVNGNAFSPNGKVKVLSRDSIAYGDIELDLRYIEQLVSKSQTKAIANILQRLPRVVATNNGKPLLEVLRELEEAINTDGLDSVAPGQYDGTMSRPRSFEIAGAINRLRSHNSIYQSK
jgi:predicted ABC-class ATPase